MMHRTTARSPSLRMAPEDSLRAAIAAVLLLVACGCAGDSGTVMDEAPPEASDSPGTPPPDDPPEPPPPDDPPEPLPPTSLRRGPYLQLGTPSSIVVRWRTGSPAPSEVNYGTDPDRLEMRSEDSELRTDHAVELDDLSPDTVYYYTVGTPSQVLAGDDGSCLFRTAPEHGMAVPTRIWVLGDSGTANDEAAAVRDAYLDYAGGGHTDLWLMLGDNAYPDGTDAEYQDAVFDMYPSMLRRSVLWSTLGNHDGRTADSATQTGPYYDIFTLPTRGEAGGVPSGTEAYYSFDHANVHFICLDSHETDRSPDGAMLSWLEADLLDTRQDWTIAFWHHPPYTKGSHDSDNEGQLIEMRENALPLLEASGVDLVLSGHSHSYERSYLLDGHYGDSSTFLESMKVDGGDGRDDGDGAYEKESPAAGPHEGAVYIVAGSSGKKRGGSFDHPAMFVSMSELGSLAIEVNGRRLDVIFVDDDGSRRDYFTLTKGASVP